MSQISDGKFYRLNLSVKSLRSANKSMALKIKEMQAAINGLQRTIYGDPLMQSYHERRRLKRGGKLADRK